MKISSLLSILTEKFFLHQIFQKSEAGMCLAMCLKNSEFQPDCDCDKISVYKKKMCNIVPLFRVDTGR